MEIKVSKQAQKEYLVIDSDYSKILYTYKDVSKKELEEEAKRLTYNAPYCGHEHDCCGCFVRQWAEVKSDNTIEVIEIYNY